MEKLHYEYQTQETESRKPGKIIKLTIKTLATFALEGFVARSLACQGLDLL